MKFTGMRFVATGAPYISYKLKRGEDAVTVAGKILTEYDKAYADSYAETDNGNETVDKEKDKNNKIQG